MQYIGIFDNNARTLTYRLIGCLMKRTGSGWIVLPSFCSKKLANLCLTLLVRQEATLLHICKLGNIRTKHHPNLTKESQKTFQGSSGTHSENSKTTNTTPTPNPAAQRDKDQMSAGPERETERGVRAMVWRCSSVPWYVITYQPEVSRGVWLFCSSSVSRYLINVNTVDSLH